jgi:hypothetical protein
MILHDVLLAKLVQNYNEVNIARFGRLSAPVTALQADEVYALAEAIGECL